MKGETSMRKEESYSLSTIRQKAYKINFQVEKGFIHYRDVVDHDYSGNRHTGFMVKDLETGFYVKGCYDENFDHLWEIDDVVSFLKEQYEILGIDW